MYGYMYNLLFDRPYHLSQKTVRNKQTFWITETEIKHYATESTTPHSDEQFLQTSHRPVEKPQTVIYRYEII